MQQPASLNASIQRGNADDPEYDAFLCRINTRFSDNMGAGKPLFTTDATGLFDAYLAAFPESERQHHNCNACRSFINRFGGLVTIDANGDTLPAFWNVDDAPDYYKPALFAIVHRVLTARVTGVFLTKEIIWGQPKTGEWSHLSVDNLPSMIHRDRLKTAGQAMAEKREDFKNVTRALEAFPYSVTQQAMNILSTDALYRTEKVIGPAQWLHELHQSRIVAKSTSRAKNLTWLAIATAPAGFCHPRSSMIGTLLEDISAGMSYDSISKRFAAKMHPLQYQRPQAAPSAGNIAQAEKIVEQLGIAQSLKRRFARLEEIPTLWKPKALCSNADGSVFGHLKPKGDNLRPLNLPMTKITWEKFARTVLPGAVKMELELPSMGAFCGILTAEDFDAPPIIQWDQPERRNPFSWYGYVTSSSPAQWNLPRGDYAEVTGIALQPSMWYGHYPQHGEGAFFILKDCRDTNSPHLCLFPELLKHELREIRSTIEAFSRSGKASGNAEASACGIKIIKGSTFAYNIRVTDDLGNTAKYQIDRWD